MALLTFGQTGSGGNTSTSSADANLVNRSTEANSSPTSNGTLVSVTWRTNLSVAGSFNAKGVIYNASGVPLATGDQVTITSTTVQSIVLTFSGVNLISLVSGTGYAYGVFFSDPGTPNVTWYRQTTTSTSFKNNTSYALGPQNPLGSGTVSGPVDMFVTYDTGSPPPPVTMSYITYRPPFLT